MRNQHHFALLGMALACIAFVPACPAADIQNAAAEASETAEDPAAEELPHDINIPAKTLGGSQLWGDELVFHDWRIQRNVLTGQYRLLDNKDVRQQSGNWVQCVHALKRQQRERGLPPLRGRVVLLVHGLGRTRHSMESMMTHLREQGGYEAMTVGYPSMRQGIKEHAAGLKSVIDHLGPEVYEINFVAHSLGNLVIRQYLHDSQKEDPDGQIDSRIGRVVMLGPPNQDACITRLFHSEKMFQFAVKGTGEQLSEQLPKLSSQWGTPPCEFAVIAGGKSDNAGWNPLLEGDDDLIVRVEETKLPGAKHFSCVPVIHTFLMDDAEVQKITLAFLRGEAVPAPKNPTE